MGEGVIVHRSGSDWFGTVRFGSERFDSDRFGSVRTGSVRTGSDRTGSVRTGSDRTGSVRTGGPEGKDLRCLNRTVIREQRRGWGMRSGSTKG